MKEEKRSPLKDKPLRNPGQSLDEAIGKLIDEESMPYFAAAFVAVVLAIYEWYRWYSGAPPQPLAFTLVAIVTVAYATVKIIRTFSTVTRMKLGRDGERVVGQFLDRLREQGCHIYHDILGDKFNIDHVVVGPKGIFIVETKTISKRGRGEAKIIFDGEQLLVQGVKLDRDPIVQARAEASWLRDVLFESTGRKVSIRPIVTFPGWYVDPPPKGGRFDVWVLNTKAIPAFIEHERDTLTPEDVKLLSYHLSRYVRSTVADV